MKQGGSGVLPRGFGEEFLPCEDAFYTIKEENSQFSQGNFQKFLESMFTNPKNYGILL